MQFLIYSIADNSKKEKVMMEMALHLTSKNHTNKIQMPALFNFGDIYLVYNESNGITELLTRSFRVF